MKFKKGDTVIYPQHGACIVRGSEKLPFDGGTREYLILKSVIGDMTLKVPVENAGVVGVRPPVNADELDDLVSVLSKPDPRVPSNWSRRFKNHQEKLKSGDVYQVAEVVRNLAARNRDAALSAAERTMYERARINLVSEIAPALKVSAEEAEAFLDSALAKGVLKPAKGAAKTAAAEGGAAKPAKPAPEAPASTEAAKKAAPADSGEPAPAPKAAKSAPKTATSEKAEKPAAPAKATKPAAAKAEKPAKPAKAEKPAAPAKPVAAAKPAAPEKAAKPVKAAAAAKAAKPAAPAAKKAARRS